MTTSRYVVAPREPTPEQYYAEGWKHAAHWAAREDLISDLDSPAYEQERDAVIKQMRAIAAIPDDPAAPVPVDRDEWERMKIELDAVTRQRDEVFAELQAAKERIQAITFGRNQAIEERGT